MIPEKFGEQLPGPRTAWVVGCLPRTCSSGLQLQHCEEESRELCASVPGEALGDERVKTWER